MEAFVASFALLVAFAVFVAALGLAARMAGRADLQLWKVLARRGIAAPADAPAGEARLVRRCVLCANVQDCDEWLASGKATGVERFCPNAAALEKLGVGIIRR